MTLSEIFVDVTMLPKDGYGLFQIICIGCVYGYILCFASNLISDGSELLLLVPSFAGIVGSVVLPVLGAVPDGCIVLFSGMGPDAQENLSVGIGALCGSTILLLTLPWFLSVFGGRVDIHHVTGKPNYCRPKLANPKEVSMLGSGVAITPPVKASVYFMFGTCLSFFVLQVPGLWALNKSVAEQAAAEKYWALLGFALCCLLFMAYLYYQFVTSNDESSSQFNKRNKFIQESIERGEISLIGLLSYELKKLEEENPIPVSSPLEEMAPGGSNRRLSGGNSNTSDRRASTADRRSTLSDGGSRRLSVNTRGETSPLLQNSTSSYSAIKQQRNLKKLRLELILRPFYNKYDTDRSGSLDITELSGVFRDMGEVNISKNIQDIFAKYDTDGNGEIDYNEFVDGTLAYVEENRTLLENERSVEKAHDIENRLKEEARLKEEEEEDDDEQEIPAELDNLTPAQQQMRILTRAALMLVVGTVIVLLISDPMVDIFTELASRTGVNQFYVAFLLAPLASNATEVIAAYKYAGQKTSTSITISLSTLVGAACMNNTFVLGIFMMLVYYNSLAFEYVAEMLAVVLVQCIVGCMVLYKNHHTVLDGGIILFLYPVSLGFVAYMKGYGWN